MRRHIISPPKLQALDLQELGAELHIYGEIDDPDMRHFNPSIAWHDGKLKIAIRSCNFAVEKQGKWYLRDGSAYSKTDVLYGDFDPDCFVVSNLTKLTLSKDSPTKTLVSGLEDVRLYSRKDGMYAIGFESDRLTRSLHNASTRMAEYLIKGSTLEYVWSLQKPDPNGVEKNWSPTDEPSKEFDFTYSPTQVWKSGEVIGDKYTGDIHGGTQLLKQRNGTYLSIVHKKTMNRQYNRPGVYDKYVYHHYLARHNKQGFITHLTKPFTFGTHENIEFASGMVEYEDRFLITLGIRDCKWAVAKVDREKLINMLESFTV